MFSLTRPYVLVSPATAPATSFTTSSLLVGMHPARGGGPPYPRRPAQKPASPAQPPTQPPPPTETYQQDPHLRSSPDPLQQLLQSSEAASLPQTTTATLLESHHATLTLLQQQQQQVHQQQQLQRQQQLHQQKQQVQSQLPQPPPPTMPPAPAAPGAPGAAGSSSRRAPNPGRAHRFCHVCRTINHVRRKRCTNCAAPKRVVRSSTGVARGRVDTRPLVPRGDAAAARALREWGHAIDVALHDVPAAADTQLHVSAHAHPSLMGHPQQTHMPLPHMPNPHMPHGALAAHPANPVSQPPPPPPPPPGDNSSLAPDEF